MKDLSRDLLSEEIRSLYRERRSGVLAAFQGEVTKGIFFRSGQIVFAGSTADSDKLGEDLIRRGRISREDFARAYAATQTERRRLGEVLIGQGLMTQEELGRLVGQQVQRIVLSAFVWTTGSLDFVESPDAVPADLAVDLSTHRLLLEGVRMFPEMPRLERALGDLDRRLRPALRYPFDYSKLRPVAAEQAVLSDASAGYSVAQILERPGTPRPLLVRAVYALLAGGILEEVEQEESPIIEEDTGAFRLAISGTPAPPQPSPSARQRVLAMYESMARATHYELLGVRSDASAAAIQAAYDRLVGEQDGEWKLLAQDLRMSSVLSTLRFRIRDAHGVLSDPIRRAAYDKWLGSLRPGPAPAAAPAAAEAPRAAPLKRAQALLSEGEVERAIGLLLEAIATDPKDRLCRRLLALALAQHPNLFRQAERHFIAALEMAPGDAELRFQFALYYKRAGLQSRAQAQLKAVLAAQPGHEAARRELETLRPGRS